MCMHAVPWPVPQRWWERSPDATTRVRSRLFACRIRVSRPFLVGIDPSVQRVLMISASHRKPPVFDTSHATPVLRKMVSMRFRWSVRDRIGRYIPIRHVSLVTSEPIGGS